MKLSVVIPMYNAENYIETTLYSLINTKYNQFELILIDDGSIDRSHDKAKEILEKNKVPNYKLIKQENAGVSSARNRGLNESTGDYVFFLDSDDYVSTDYIEIIFDAIDSIRTDIICWGFNIVNSNKTIINEYFDTYNSSFDIINGTEALKKIMIERSFWIWTGSAIYKRSFLLENELNYTEGCTNGEDQEFTYKALYNAKDVSFLNKILSFYVMREGSITNSYNIKRFDVVEAMKRTYKYINSKSNMETDLITNKFFEKHIIKNYFEVLHSCYYHSKGKKISKIVNEIDRDFPGLNIEIKKLVKEYKGDNLINSTIVKSFILSPNLYFLLVRIKSKINIRKLQ